MGEVSIPWVLWLCVPLGIAFVFAVLAAGLYAWDGVVFLVSRIRSRKKQQPPG